MKLIYIILSISALLFACKKDRQGKDVEIFLLKSFQLVPGKCEVDAATATLQADPLVPNSRILLYRQDDYQYFLDDLSYQSIKSLTPRTPFAVTVDKKVIFYGIYMPSIMSSTCGNSITMDILGTEKKIHLRLGYPWPMGSIDDQRNNPEIITAFRRQGKLR